MNMIHFLTQLFKSRKESQMDPENEQVEDTENTEESEAVDPADEAPVEQTEPLTPLESADQAAPPPPIGERLMIGSQAVQQTLGDVGTAYDRITSADRNLEAAQRARDDARESASPAVSAAREAIRNQRELLDEAERQLPA